MVNFRVVQIDPNMDLVMYSVRIQHVKTWQDLLPVLQNKGDLEKFCTEILMQLGIHYNSPPFKREIFVKEFPEQQSISNGATNFVE